jgi:hypothetical protein
MSWAKTQQRNQKIYAERLKGRTFKSIAKQFCLSPARVSQICGEIVCKQRDAVFMDLLFINANAKAFRRMTNPTNPNGFPWGNM